MLIPVNSAVIPNRDVVRKKGNTPKMPGGWVVGVVFNVRVLRGQWLFCGKSYRFRAICDLICLYHQA